MKKNGYFGNKNALGTVHTKEYRENVSKRMLGKKYALGTVYTKEYKENARKRALGSKNGRYIKDRTKLKKGDVRKYAHTEWKNRVHKRDNYECRLKNNECHGRLEAHHIFNWTDYPQLRYIISNGISLCHFHHPLKWEDEVRMESIFQEIIKQPNGK